VPSCVSPQTHHFCVIGLAAPSPVPLAPQDLKDGSFQGLARQEMKQGYSTSQITRRLVGKHVTFWITKRLRAWRYSRYFLFRRILPFKRCNMFSFFQFSPIYTHTHVSTKRDPNLSRTDTPISLTAIWNIMHWPVHFILTTTGSTLCVNVDLNVSLVEREDSIFVMF